MDRSWVRKWPKQIEGVVVSAAKAAGLPYQPVRGFDGDGWVWIWTERGDSNSKIAEVRFRASPDIRERSIYVEVSAAAQYRGRPPWMRKPWSDHVEVRILED